MARTKQTAHKETGGKRPRKGIKTVPPGTKRPTGGKSTKTKRRFKPGTGKLIQELISDL